MIFHQAGIVELPGPGELPDDHARFSGGDLRHVWLVVMHVLLLLHHLAVRFELLHRSKHHLMLVFPGINDDEADGFTCHHGDIGREKINMTTPLPNPWSRGLWGITPAREERLHS